MLPLSESLVKMLSVRNFLNTMIWYITNVINLNLFALR